MFVYITAAVLIVVAVVLVFVARSKSGLKQTMEMTNTTTVRELRDGDYVELKGRAVCQKPLTAPYCDQPCLYYSYKIESREEKRDSDGKTSYNWRTVDNGSAYAQFQIDDGTGVAAVDAERAKFDTRRIAQRTIGAGNMGDLEVFGINLRLGSQQQRVTVYAVTAGSDLYLLGTARRQSDGSFCIAKGDEGRFFISSRSEEEIVKSLGRQSLGFYIGAAATACGGVALALCQAMGVFGKG